eukprot:5914560-Pyramimonas_sp.AAC.1
MVTREVFGSGGSHPQTNAGPELGPWDRCPGPPFEIELTPQWFQTNVGPARSIRRAAHGGYRPWV